MSLFSAKIEKRWGVKTKHDNKHENKNIFLKTELLSVKPKNTKIIPEKNVNHITFSPL
jgi:hypothetical protein